MSLLLLRVGEPIARMEDAQIVRELHIALLEVERNGISLSEEMQRVEGFGLRLSDGWNVGRAWETLEAGECAARVLDDQTLGGVCCCWLEVKEWSRDIEFGLVTEAGDVSVSLRCLG